MSPPAHPPHLLPVPTEQPIHPSPKQRNMFVPGTKCPTCAARGKEVWVIPGRLCGQCGTPCD
ncbi:hypothetical protein NLU13_4061 [Sarocladium strictum]|uniref:Uncharacterized protein n=1 Tax=Sarocladium strictum TaxID=5046 RepID=A0AA39GII5_SARSR|nr:hypothetical protein NLU13_4061 [Sarocladium strictum]